MEAYLLITLKTILVYVLIVVVFRIMGKREIGELGVLDLVVFVMIAEVAVLAIEKYDESFIKQVYPIVLLLFMQVSLAIISLKYRSFRKLVDGEPTIIIKDGKIMERAMRQQRYNFDDLMMQLRENKIQNISDVAYALLEPTGKLSVFKKEDNKTRGFTFPIILDGEIQYDKLKELKRNEEWLLSELKNRGFRDINKISFCTYSDGEFFIDLKK